MKDTKTTLLIPSTDLGNGTVYVHKTPYLPEFKRDGNTLVKDAVLSSCSAPFYFEAVKLNNGVGEPYLFSDGGLWANNPSLLALVEAMNPKRLNKNLTEISILSIGTGISNKKYDFGEKKWGLKDWGYGLDLVNTVMSLQSQNPHNMISLLLPPEQYLRINFNTEEKLELNIYREEYKSKAGQDFTYNVEKIRKFFES